MFSKSAKGPKVTNWSPHPRAKITRRPQPDFCHRKTRIKQRVRPHPNPEPDPRCNYKYFGIQRSDVTDYLKHVVPSHAFHPSLVGAPPPPVRGRCPRNLRSIDERRPETAPAATVWFGRNCSDVSDWLRYRPPAHLGLDPDNKPLPHYPTTSSIVTDSKWQTRDYPALPNVLWHWWADRPSSVPLATNPQHVKFDALVDAVKDKVIYVKPPRFHTPDSDAAVIGGEAAAGTHMHGQTPGERGGDPEISSENGIHTPRGNPLLGTSRSAAQTPRGDQSQRTPRSSSAQTPRLGRGGEISHDQEVASVSARCGHKRPSSAPGANLGLGPGLGYSERSGLRDEQAQPGLAAVLERRLPTPRKKSNTVTVGTSPRQPSTPRPHSAAGEYPSCTTQKSPPIGPCRCGKGYETTKTSCNNAPLVQGMSPRQKLQSGHDQSPVPTVDAQDLVSRCKCNRSFQVQQASTPRSRGGDLKGETGTPAPSPRAYALGGNNSHGSTQSTSGIPRVMQGASAWDNDMTTNYGASGTPGGQNAAGSFQTASPMGGNLAAQGPGVGRPGIPRLRVANASSQVEASTCDCSHNNSIPRGSDSCTPKGPGPPGRSAIVPPAAKDLLHDCSCDPLQMGSGLMVCGSGSGRARGAGAASSSACKPPPSPHPSHNTPAHGPNYQRQPSLAGHGLDVHRGALPSGHGLYIQGQGQGPNSSLRAPQTGANNNHPQAAAELGNNTCRSSHGLGPTVEDFKRMSPHTFATTTVWAEKFRKHGQAMPHTWSHEEEAFKSVKAC